MAAAGWLLLHHVAIGFPGGRVGLVPLGLTLVPALAVYRSARRLGADPVLSPANPSTPVNLRPVAQAAAGLALAYAAVATLVALLAGSAEVRPVLWQAPIGPAGLALLAGGAGLLRGHPRAPALRAQLAGRLPVRVRRALRPAAVGASVVLAAGVVAVGLAVAADADRVLALHRALQPGAFGGAVLVVGQLGYLPDLAAWATSWFAGPGFAVGTGTVVSVAHVQLGVLPVVPVFGALPARPLTSSWAIVVAFAVPVLAGCVVGWRSARRAPADDLGLASRLLDALVAAVTTALLLGRRRLLGGRSDRAGPVGARGGQRPARGAVPGPGPGGRRDAGRGPGHLAPPASHARRRAAVSQEQRSATEHWSATEQLSATEQ